MLRLNNPAQERSLSSIVASIPDDDRAKVVRALIKLERRLEQQEKFDVQVAAALDRILNAPRENVRALAKQIRKHIKEIAK